MQIYTKDQLITALREIKRKGWIPTGRKGNDGGIGNTLEDLLGIQENNLPIPNAAEWELKTQRKDTTSLVTLFHLEPSPRACKFVPLMLLPKYGWKHESAGTIYPATEMSFRQTIHGLCRSDRGFKVVVNRPEKKIQISFDCGSVNIRHIKWLEDVKNRAGLSELDPQPYWGFDDLFHKAGTKLHNCFFAQAETKKINGQEHFYYSNIYMLKSFDLDKFLRAIELGNVLVDFDARTGHNHGTKFRLRQKNLIDLYAESIEL